ESYYPTFALQQNKTDIILARLHEIHNKERNPKFTRKAQKLRRRIKKASSRNKQKAYILGKTGLSHFGQLGMMELWSGSRWNNYGSVEQDPLNSVVKRVLGPYVLQVCGIRSLDFKNVSSSLSRVKALINHNFSYLRQSIERTPLHEAVKNNQAEVVKHLVEVCANVNNEDVRGITPLDPQQKERTEISKYNSIVQILVSAKASPNIAYLDTGIYRIHLRSWNIIKSTQLSFPVENN
ncbi:hypothetical protein E2986_09495, partial [Frieseomelitta varia]